MSDLELISLSLTAEYMGIDSEKKATDGGKRDYPGYGRFDETDCEEMFSLCGSSDGSFPCAEAGYRSSSGNQDQTPLGSY